MERKKCRFLCFYVCFKHESTKKYMDIYVMFTLPPSLNGKGSIDGILAAP